MKVVKFCKVFLTLLFFCIFFNSCNSQIKMESTPTISGNIMVPGNSGLELKGLWVKVVDDNTLNVSKIVQTDADGNFKVNGLSDKTTYTLYFSSNRPSDLNTSRSVIDDSKLIKAYANKKEEVRAIKSINDVGVVMLRPTGFIRGKVTLDGVDANMNYGISVYIPGTSYIALTSEDGSYTISGIPQGFYKVRYEKSGYSSVLSEQFTLATGAEDLETNPSVSLPEKVLIGNYGTVLGNIYLDGFDDCSGVVIKVERQDKPGSKTTVSSEDGSFSIYELDPGTYKAIASYAGYSSVCSKEFVVESSKTTIIEDKLCLYKNVGTIIGNVILSEKSSHEGISVLIQNDDKSLSYSTTTDMEGNFSKIVKAGTYNITCSYSGYISKEVNQILIAKNQTIPVEDVTLVSKYGSVSGNISQGNVNITIIPNGETTPIANTLSGENGDFRFNNIEIGSYSIVFNKIGFIEKSLSNFYVVNGNETKLDKMSLTPSSGVISGNVLLSGQTDNSGVLVTATLVKDPTKYYTTTSISDGSYKLLNVDEGGYSITLKKDGFVGDSSKIASVSLGSVTSIESVTLNNERVTVNGYAKLDGSVLHEGIIVLMKNLSNSRQYTSTTDRDGKYIINDVVPDVYTIYASKNGYSSTQSNRVTIEPTVDKTVENLFLPIAIRSITGTVDLELSEDNSGALITATNVVTPEKIYSAISNGDGNFTLAGMVAGEYNISITNTGYRSVTKSSINVLSNSSQDLGKIELPIARGTISGYIKLEGRTDYSGVEVILNGTDYKAITDKNGLFNFYVPAGNYPGGVSYSKEDFLSMVHAGTITVLTDSTYAIKDIDTLTATNIPLVKGIVDVRGTNDNSGVKISIENTTFVYETEESGYFQFQHLPVGSYSVRFIRENTPDIVVPLQASPNKEINMSTITMTPNSASISGNISLSSISNYKGVKVSVVTEGESGIVETTTDDGGYFYIGGLLSSGTHNVSFSKEGWESKSLKVSNLSPLENRDITKNSPIELVDFINPVLSSVVINSGANTAADKNVIIHLSAEDAGSKLYKMQITNRIEDFDRTVEMMDYKSSFNWILEPDNGTKNVYVKVYDTAGNSSSIQSATIQLTDQKTEVSNILSGDKLHWTAEKSPYLVTGNVLVESGTELTIDPGVDIQFIGPYYIQVGGTLTAIGDDDNRIKFYGIEDGVDAWRGIRFVNNTEVKYEIDHWQLSYISGSRLSYCDILNSCDGLGGSVYVDNSNIETKYQALGKSKYEKNSEENYWNIYIENSYRYSGVIEQSNISGACFIDEAIIFNNHIDLNSKAHDIESINLRKPNSESPKLTLNGSTSLMFGNILLNGYMYLNFIDYYDDYDSKFNIINNEFINVDGYISVKNIFANNSLDSSSIYFPITLQSNHHERSISNNSFKSNEYITNRFVYEYNDMKSSQIKELGNYFSNIEGENYIVNNYGNNKDLPLTYFNNNYWGERNTFELENSEYNKNMSFIQDYYDDFTKTKIDYSGFSSHRFEHAGYQGDKFVDFEVKGDITTKTLINDDYSMDKNDTIVSLTFENITVNELDEFRFSFNLNDLSESDYSGEWRDISNGIFTISSEDTDYSAEYAFVQVKDIQGNISGIQRILVDQQFLSERGNRVFYDKGDASEGWRYLEMAPNDLIVNNEIPTCIIPESGSINSSFCFGYLIKSNSSEMIGTSTDIGQGENNTNKIVESLGTQAYMNYDIYNKTILDVYAAKLCYDLVFQDKNDWFLPSRDELKIIGEYNCLNNGIYKTYWSSSEKTNIEVYSLVVSGQVYHDISLAGKGCGLFVRPVRSF